MTIKKYLEEWGISDGEYSYDFQRALDGDTTQAAQIWAQIEEGTASVAETLLWAQRVAHRVNTTVVTSTQIVANRRAEAALKAIGFYGQIDDYYYARNFMEDWSAFKSLDEIGPSPRVSAKTWLQLLKKEGYLLDATEKSAINRINEWRKELNID